MPGLGELGRTEELGRTVVLVVENVGDIDRPQPVGRAVDNLDVVAGLERPFGEDPQVDAVATGLGKALGNRSSPIRMPSL